MFFRDYCATGVPALVKQHSFSIAVSLPSVLFTFRAFSNHYQQ